MRRFRRLRRAARYWWVPLLLLLLVLVVPLIWIGVVCEPFRDVPPQVVTAETAPRPAATQELTGYFRNEEQTYLTLPEWYIVYSAEEYAAFIQANEPSGFPYFGAIGQYWRSYADVCAITKGRYAFNSTYHMTLYVIGISFTVENIVKGLYENTIGRVSEWVSSPELTEEDALHRQVSAEYGEFMHMIPWFEFPFFDKLAQLWTTTGYWGRNPLRKWERKFFLNMEYGGKGIYGALIRQGAAVAYGPEMDYAYAIITGYDEETARDFPEVAVVEQLDGGQTLVGLPRYEGFTQTVPKLAGRGVEFVEIAGNQHIMITVIAPRDWSYNLEVGETLFALNVMTQPNLQRMAIRVPVSSLHTVLAALEAEGVALEHLYDY